MKRQKIDLALAFLESQPTSAAAVLESQSMEDVALFLCDVPYKQAALVLKKMLPQYIAKLCQYLDPIIAAGFLSKMETGHVASILRHSDRATNKKILTSLPKRTRIACNLLLDYSEDTVGAWMMTNIKTLPDDCNVEEALKRLAIEEDIIEMDVVYVVNRERYLQGSVSILNILKSPPHVSIKTLMQNNLKSISGRSSLVTAFNSSIWHCQEIAVVLNKDGMLLGVLRHLDLRRGMRRISNTISKPKTNDPTTGIVEVYGSSLLTLFNTIADSTNTKKP